MPLLYRTMREDTDGMPFVAPSARGLGARPGTDVPALADHDHVNPGEGGPSVAPDDPNNLLRSRRPLWLGGTSRDPLWVIDSDDLGPDLVYRPDPARPTEHGFIEPAQQVELVEYQRLLAATRPLWRRVVAPGG
jgi:hypothetical protein